LGIVEDTSKDSCAVCVEFSGRDMGFYTPTLCHKDDACPAGVSICLMRVVYRGEVEQGRRGRPEGALIYRLLETEEDLEWEVPLGVVIRDHVPTGFKDNKGPVVVVYVDWP